MTNLPPEVADVLMGGAERADQMLEWPEQSLDAIQSAGVFSWSILQEFGGTAICAHEQLIGIESIAMACLTTAFILSQREAAVRQVLRGPVYLRERYLPGLASGDQFLTVGISQLTTSRQHRGPALRATENGDSFELHGEIPWVTGADQADAIVAGATLPNHSQLLVVLPTNLPGVAVGPPLPLAALRGSRTCQVRCEGVTVEPEQVLAGPDSQVLGTTGGGGLETSCLALGLTRAAVDYLDREAADRQYLVPVTTRFRDRLNAARHRVHELATDRDAEGTLALRVECTRLALRATQIALITAKGAGFLTTHPAQRWARQALFFLVWSCPRPVAAGILDELTAQV